MANIRKYVKYRFGTTCASSELRALREEFTEKAQAVYDRELLGGATHMQARDRALDAISNMSEVLQARHIPKRQRVWKTRMALLFFSALAVLIFGGELLTHRTRSEAMMFANLGLIAVGLQTVGTICLIWKTRNECLPILCLIVGSLLLLLVLNSLDVRHHDYREEFARIRSMELIEVTQIGNYEDEFEYRVLQSVAPSQWQALVDDIAMLDYHYYVPNPQFWYAGQIKLLIRFEPGEDDLVFALIGDENPGYGKVKGSRVKITAESQGCSAWNALAEKYGLNVQP